MLKRSLTAVVVFALGENFNLQQFNDFILAQSLSPPDQLAVAVETQLIPAHKTH